MKVPFWVVKWKVNPRDTLPYLGRVDSVLWQRKQAHAWRFASKAEAAAVAHYIGGPFNPARVVRVVARKVPQ